MTTADQVQELIHRSWNTPDGPGRIALAEQAMLHAEANGDPDIAYRARVAATSAYHQGGEPSKAMMTFARCLADYDADPSRRSAEDERLMLWQFKFVVSGMLSFHEIPLDRTQAVLDDMERRYRAGGHSLHAVYAYRHSVAAHLGEATTVDYWYRMWDTAPRDRNSDCAGCDPTSKANHHIWFGSDEDAITVAESALSGRLSCSEQPQSILTTLLLPYLRTGGLEEARNAHRRAYRALSDNVSNLGLISKHIHFCGLTGNEMRGLELIERHLSWLERPPSPRAAMDFAAAAAQVLLRLAETGQGDLNVRRAGDPVTVAELAESLRAKATEIAARFDARNANSYWSGIIASKIAAKPLVAYLPLSVTAAFKTDSGVPGKPAEAIDLSDVPPGLSLDEQLDAAEAMMMELDPRANTLIARMLPQFADASLSPLQRGRLLRLQATADRANPAAAVSLYEKAIEEFILAGDRERELQARGQLAFASMEMTGDTSFAKAGIAVTQEALTTADDPLKKANLLVRLAYLHLMSGDQAEALSQLDGIPGTLPPRRQAQVLSLRAGVLLQAGDVEVAIAQLRTAAELLRQFGPSDILGGTLMQLASALSRSGDHLGTIAAFEEASVMGVDRELRRSARANAGFMLVSTDRAGEFIDDIVEHVCLMVAEGQDAPANHTRHRLAVALHTVGRSNEAAEVAEEALAWFTEHGDDTELVVQLRNLLASIYVDIHEPQVAIGQLNALAELLEGPQRAIIVERSAELLSQVDRDREASLRFAEAAQAYAQADLTLMMLHAWRRRAMTLHYDGQRDEALAAVAKLAELFTLVEVPADEQAEFTWEWASAGYDAALILSNHDSPDYPGALAHIEPVAARYRSIQAFEEAAFAEFRHGQVLVVAGRAADAQPVLERVLSQLPADHGARREAAGWLARAFDEQGEKRKARKLRKEFNLPEQ